jgi:hypothetical protein
MEQDIDTIECAKFDETVFKTFEEPRNRFQGIDITSICSLAGRFDNPILTRFLAPMCIEIPVLV